ncbi:hypothetical protein BH11PAT3_BH11PAT3_2130 [soil metagenome]
MLLVFGFGVVIVIYGIYNSRKKILTPDEQSRATQFKNCVEEINTAKSEHDPAFRRALCIAYEKCKTEKEFDQLCKAVNGKASYAVIVLQGRWAQEKDTGYRQPLPSYLLAN